MKLKREKNAHQPIMNFALKNTTKNTSHKLGEKIVCVCVSIYVCTCGSVFVSILYTVCRCYVCDVHACLCIHVCVSALVCVFYGGVADLCDLRITEAWFKEQQEVRFQGSTLHISQHRLKISYENEQRRDSRNQDQCFQ